MSYALELTDAARQGLAQLDIWLQEETLDELDRVASDPPQRRRRIGNLVHDFVRKRGDATYYVFIVVLPDAQSRVLRVENVAQYVRPS